MIANNLIRKCPQCKKALTYSGKGHLIRAIKNNAICKGCKAKNQEVWKHSILWKNHLKYCSMIWKKQCPRCGVDQIYKNKRNFDTCTKRNTVCRRCQLITRKPTYLDKPNYNPKACNFFDKLNKERGWNLQHALNGGEAKILYYFVDAYDKNRNIVVEYDEHRHKYYNKQKDEKRQKEIINHLNCDLYRYDEPNNLLLQIHIRKHQMFIPEAN